MSIETLLQEEALDADAVKEWFQNEFLSGKRGDVSSLDRVRTALSHNEPDRVPVDF